MGSAQLDLIFELKYKWYTVFVWSSLWCNQIYLKSLPPTLWHIYLSFLFCLSKRKTHEHFRYYISVGEVFDEIWYTWRWLQPPCHPPSQYPDIYSRYFSPIMKPPFIFIYLFLQMLNFRKNWLFWWSLFKIKTKC